MKGEKWPKFKSPAHKECPVCRRFMVADEVMHKRAWQCRNLECSERPAFLRYTTYAAVSRDRAGLTYRESCAPDSPAFYRVLHCCFCDHPVEIIDSTYVIWNCPNCRIVRHGLSNFIDYDEAGTEIDRTYHLFWDPYAADDVDGE